VVESGTRETGGSLFGGASEVDTTEAILRLNIPLIQRFETGPQIKCRRPSRVGSTQC